MKKIISILFLFLLCYTCYYIYNKTEDNKLYISLIGDKISANPYLLPNKEISNINKDFINENYHINDLLNIIQYNQELKVNDKTESIHQIFKKSDIIILSIGMNDIYYKLNDNIKEIYTYLNNIINNYELILDEISNYDYKNVYILGYYNIFNKYNDIFTYINYKLKKLSDKYNYTYINLNTLSNNSNYYQFTNNFNLNNDWYYQIYKIIVEKLKKYWYNIKCIYYYDLN